MNMVSNVILAFELRSTEENIYSVRLIFEGNNNVFFNNL